jgi:hypothetical protein
MELVLLADVQGGYGSQWIRIANTQGVAEIKIGDCFREQGFGQGSEELKVAGVDISPVGGASKIFVDRGANATQPMTHRLGAVMEQVGVPLQTGIDYRVSLNANELAMKGQFGTREAPYVVQLDEGMEMVSVARTRSANAERQQRYRDRQKAK